MNRRVALAVVLVVAFMGAYAHGQFGTQPAKLGITKIKDNLYVIHNDFVPGNTTALVTNAGVLLVDDKFEIDHENILAQLKTVTNQPVRYVVNTHHHADHSGGNAKLQALNVKVVMSEQAREKMVQGKQPGLPDFTIEGKGNIYLGNQRIEIHHFGRAHTDGDVVVYFPEQRVLAAGDMYTVSDATPQLIDYAGGGSARDWTRTVDGALQLDFDTVVPGHGAVTTTKAEMRKFRESTLALRNRVRDMLAKKASRDDVARMLRSEFHWVDLHLNAGLDGLLLESR